MSRRKDIKRHRRLRRTSGKQWCFVYVLKATENDPPMYVGQTRILPQDRLRWHFRAIKEREALKRALSPVQVWLKSLVQPPIIEIVDHNGKWDISEAVWIDRFRRDGIPLYNVQSVVPLA